MLHNIKAVIFDLDGTLVDSMWVWANIDEEYLGRYGYEVPENFNAEINHMSFTQLALYFKEKFSINDPVEKILCDWSSMAYDHYSNDVKLKCGVKEFLDVLKNSGIKICLATSNSKELLSVCLKSNGIYEYFDSITTTDEVSRGKDFPDVYLLSSEKVGVSPENCLVFEDILPAIKGAKNANMKVCAVKDKYCVNSREELSKFADKYIDSFLELL